MEKTSTILNFCTERIEQFGSLEAYYERLLIKVTVSLIKLLGTLSKPVAVPEGK